MPENQMKHKHIYAESNDWRLILETEINEYFLNKKGEQVMCEQPCCGPFVPNNIKGLTFQASYWHPEWGAFIQRINKQADIRIYATKTSIDEMVNDIRTILERDIELEFIDISENND